MNPLNLDEVNEFVNEHIVDFHRRRVKSLEELTLSKVIKKNPYLFRAKNLMTAGELINSLLDAFLSSSEEKLFGDFLEDLALFIASKTCNGHKSTAPGVDLEFTRDQTYYIVSIKSGPSWGNSSQQSKLADDLQKAAMRIKQSRISPNVQPVLGICYGKTRTSYLRGYMKVVGQNFWYLISGDKDLYIKIVEPIGYRAKEHNDDFDSEKARVTNRFTKAFLDDFCDDSGSINWESVVAFNSANFDLEEFAGL
jgi:hypothetical protein